MNATVFSWDFVISDLFLDLDQSMLRRERMTVVWKFKKCCFLCKKTWALKWVGTLGSIVHAHTNLMIFLSSQFLKNSARSSTLNSQWTRHSLKTTWLLLNISAIISQLVPQSQLNTLIDIYYNLQADKWNPPWNTYPNCKHQYR